MKKEKKHQGLDRYLILAFIIILISIKIIYELAIIQIVDSQKHKEAAIYRLSAEGSIYPKRGDIFDRNGVPIAGSRMGYCVQYVDVGMSNKEKNSIILSIIEILEKDKKTIKSNLGYFIDINPVRFKTDKVDNLIKSIVVNKTDAKGLISADQVFQYMRKKTFEIEDSYTTEQAFKIMKFRYEILMKQPQINNPLILADDISIEIMSEFEERSSQLRGVTTFIKPYRVYYESARLIPHVLGYVRSISEEELGVWNEKLKNVKDSVPYDANDIIGKVGIERAAESILRGVKGKTYKEVDENGKTTASYRERSAVPGNDIYLSIDLNLQKVAAESLKRNIDRIRKMGGKKNFGDANAGAVVVTDVNTGEVLAMASYPDFDPRIFIENNNEEINKLNADVKNTPSLNRATFGSYAPGSTYKPLVGVAALESGVITPQTKIRIPYREEIGGMMMTNLDGDQGNINLEKALETSSNMFFYKVGVKTGVDNIVKWAKIFGFGASTGIETGDTEGSLASKDYKEKYILDDPEWYPANTAATAIGQLYNAFTPIQMVNYISTIANGGKRYTPHLIKMAVDDDGKIVYEPSNEFYQIPASEATLNAVKKGMVAVANSNDGTAVREFKDFPFKVAGKTGTAETGREATSSSNGLFVCYAPYDKPEIAITVVIERGVWGYHTAPVAKDILMEYFRLNEQREHERADIKNEQQTIDIIW